MTVNTFSRTREMLRNGEASTGGKVVPKDRAILSQVDDEVRKVVGKIDSLFKVICDDYEGEDFANLFSGIYAKMVKGYLKAKRKAGDLALTGDELADFWIEIQDVIVLFNKHGVRVDARLLEEVMTYGGLIYWQEFFEEEFASFTETPGIVRHAIVKHRKSPRAFLRKAKADMDGILGEEEFASFADTPGVVRYVVINCPTDPRAFLRKVEADVDNILGEEEFANFVDTPGIVRHAVVRRKNPRAFLRKVEADVDNILGEEEFASFVDTPGIVRYASVNHRKSPRAFLRKVECDVAVILGEEEFTSFAETPGVVRYAVVRHPKDPRAFLRKVTGGTLARTRAMLRNGEASMVGKVVPKDRAILSQVDDEVRKVLGRIDTLFEIMCDDYEGEEFANLFSGIYGKMVKGYLKSKKKAEYLTITGDELADFWTEIQDVIALFNKHGIRVDARLLEKVMTYGGLSYWQEFFEEEFASFADTPWIVKHAAVNYSKNPRAFLRKLKVDFTEILKEDEFASFSDTPWIARVAVLSHPKDPRAFLRKVEADVATILREEEFASFSDTPGIVRNAVVRRKNPRTFLRNMKADLTEILKEEEFASFTDTPWIVKHAAVNYRKNPRAFLRKVEADVTAILGEEEFASFSDIAWLVRHAAVRHCTDPRAFLRSDEWVKLF